VPATLEDLTRLKRLAPVGDFDDAELLALIDSKGITGAAAELWDVNVSATASLVDITESGSSRKNSQAHDKAKEMAEYYRNLYAAELELLNPVDTTPRALTRPMRR
jgi:hypothetical protein